jgi:hypothetical protein
VVVRSTSRDGVKMQVPVAVDTENGDWLAESRGIDSTLLRTNSVTRRITSVNADHSTPPPLLKVSIKRRPR